MAIRTQPVTVKMWLVKMTANYARFECPFDRDITQDNGYVYLTKTAHARLGYPKVLRVVVEADDLGSG